MTTTFYWKREILLGCTVKLVSSIVTKEELQYSHENSIDYRKQRCCKCQLRRNVRAYYGSQRLIASHSSLWVLCISQISSRITLVLNWSSLFLVKSLYLYFFGQYRVDPAREAWRCTLWRLLWFPIHACIYGLTSICLLDESHKEIGAIPQISARTRLGS